MDRGIGIIFIIFGSALLLAATVLHGKPRVEVFYEIDENVYIEDNSSGEYYRMEYDCNVFDEKTGEALDDNDTNKCKVWMYINGNPEYEISDKNHRGNRERMY